MLDNVIGTCVQRIIIDSCIRIVLQFFLTSDTYYSGGETDTRSSEQCIIQVMFVFKY